jgi:hypothetical protein
MDIEELDAQIATRNARCEEIGIAQGKSKVGDGTYKALGAEARRIVDELEVLLNLRYGGQFSAQIDETRIADARARLGM